ncbi:hypothetical protein SE17_20260 [Kouleothrix aurantiaca]|uniref:DUF4386 domain-containing protein n=1 Tax=Kouleothrix aurantiaca TaxID=186479 RepID=A0A0P9F541_9CHLR|nr:hypothetical protein SE17_20260 [Kouleothrix aurantiaca]
MAPLSLRRLTGTLLILVPLTFTICFTLLQMLFEYPDILRQPTADVLTKFQAGGNGLIAVWYVLTLSALLLVPVAVLMRRVLATDADSASLSVATAFGVLAGLVQTLGFLRWPFLVPHLAQAYLAPDASEAQRAAAAMVFEAFHRYAGMGVGEHLGYLSTSVWSLLIALNMLRLPLFGRWLGWSGMLLALGIAVGLLEPAGLELAGTINALSYLAWAIWLMVVGVVMIVRRGESVPALRPSPIAR